MPMTLIGRQTLTSSTASVTFSSIPQTYHSLKLVVSMRTSGSESTGNAFASISFNLSTMNFSRRNLYGNGTLATVGSGTSTSAGLTADSAVNSANTFSNAEMIIPNYSGSRNKAFIDAAVNEDNATNASQIFGAGLWSNLAAINAITLTGTSNLVSGSTFSLYGIS